MSLPPVFQNKNVQIGVIALAIVIGLAFLLFQILGGSNQPPPEAYLSTGGGPGGYPGGPPGGAPGGYPGGPAGYGASTGGPGGYPGGPGVGGYGTDIAGGGAPLAGAPGAKPTPKKAGPHPVTRRDPFKTPSELIPEPVPIAASLPPTNDLYKKAREKEVLEPTLEQAIRDTPDPPMRMAGALWGNRVYGVLEINGQTQVVNPGDKVGIYRVERVERDKIVLSRPSRKGRRTVEAPLAGNPSAAQQYPVPDTGVPGGPPAYGGGQGGGNTGGGRTGG